MAEPTIAAGIARALMELAVSKGAGRDALVRRSGIDPAGMNGRDGRVPIAQYAALMRAGQEPGLDPDLGLGRETLFRRLRADGVTFEQVRDGLRRETARSPRALRGSRGG